MKVFTTLRSFVCSAMVASSLAIAADTPTTFTYQGHLATGGAPYSGPANMVFRLFDAAANGTAIGGPVALADYPVTDGLVSVDLDFGADAFTGAGRWLEVSINNVVLTSRQPIRSVPYAMFALHGNEGPAGPAGPVGPQGNVGPAGANGAAGPAGAQGPVGPAGATGPQGVAGPSGAVGAQGPTGAVGPMGPAGADGAVGPIGLTGAQGPVGPQGVEGPPGPSGAQGPAGAPGAEGPTGATGPIGPAGTNGSTGPQGPAGPEGPVGPQGPQGVPGTGGEQIWVLSGANAYYITGNIGIGTTSPAMPLHVETASTVANASAIQGLATGLTGQVFGVVGASSSNQGRGMYGVAYETPTVGPTYGVYGESYSNNGVGVYGRVISSGGNTTAGDFFSASNSGRGVRGISGVQNTAGSTYGGEFEARTTNGRGVWAKATATSGLTYGLFAQSSSPLGYGVYGSNVSGSGYGVFSVGDSGASGTKSFRIDHPLDPANKYLKHYSAEGPEPQNCYNGIVTLDAEGQAWVDLPDYFASINKDPRYQLTSMGKFAAIYIADEIDAVAPRSRFRIAGGSAGMRVSWEVKAVRNDRYVQTYGAPVEVAKTAEERGQYQHPALYNPGFQR